jgi:hypothetical protein
MILKSKGLIGVSVIWVFLAGCGGGVDVSEKSETWLVTIKGAGYQEAYEYNAYEPPTYQAVKKTRPGFVVQATVQYIGPGDSAAPPQVYLKRQDGDQKIKPVYTRMENIFADDQEGKKVTKIGKNIQTGKTHIARVDYLFRVPNDATEYLLFIGDLTPIKVKP